LGKDTLPGAADVSLEELKKASNELKERIEELRRKTSMPLNSSLGDPAIDAANADGHKDLPEDEEG
jgi:hypothetical protein